MEDRTTDVRGGRALGSRYVLETVLGSGAMGEVWIARDERTGAEVAAKLLRPEFARDVALVARFVQERAILLDLRHPHVVRIRDLVVEGDDLALVMDLVRGPNLRARLVAAGRLAPEEATRVVVDVLDALGYAHERGVLHRDVKPDNVLLTDDDPAVVQLCDFGIARLAQETTVRMSGVIGTPEYIAPEIFTAELVSPAADVYAAGIVWYELMAGTSPFAGRGNSYAIAHRQVTATAPPLAGLPARANALLAALLQKDPATRPSAAEAAAELRALLPELRGLAPLPSPAPPAWSEVEDSAGGPSVAVRGTAGDQAPVDPHATAVRDLRRPPPGSPASGREPDPDSVGNSAGPLPADDGAEPWAATTAPAGGTHLRPSRSRAAAVDVPAVLSAEPVPRPWWRRPPVLVAAAALLVVAVVVGVLTLGGGSSKDGGGTQASGGAGGADDISVSGALAQAPSGLGVLRQADYDPGQHRLTVTVTYSAGAASLSGPFFEAVPPTAAGGACPDAAWDGAGAVRDTTVGIDPSACGWEVDLSGVDSGAQAQARYVLPFTPAHGTDVHRALSDYLATAAKQTTGALDQLTSGPAYPAQRLEALEVDVTGSVRVASQIPVVVLPVWSGASSADYVDPVFDSSTARNGPLVQALGGTLTLTSPDCGSAIGFADNAPYANQPAQRCTISAQLGQLRGSSRVFDIGLNSTG